MASSGNGSTVYGGDEVNAIVLDPGSYCTRIGYAGDDFPRVTVSSNYGTMASNNRVSKLNKYIHGEGIDVPRPNYNVNSIIKDSIISDWDGAIDQHRYYFNKVLCVDYAEQPILITEPVWAEPEYRKQLVETYYESFEFAGLYLAKTPTCVSFQQGRPNCLVVDIGHDSVSVTPVIDGISLLRNSVRTNYGGQFLSDQIKDYLSNMDPKPAVQATYKIKSKTSKLYPEAATFLARPFAENITYSFDEYQKSKIWHEMKELAVQVPESGPIAENLQLQEKYSAKSFAREFEFPTGQLITLGVERFALGDSIFNPGSVVFKDSALAAKYPLSNGVLNLKNTFDDYRPLKRMRKVETNSTAANADGDDSNLEDNVAAIEARGIALLVTYALSTIDIDLRALAAHNIIITGGVSLIPHLTERLYTDLSSSNPGLKIRLHAIGNSAERANQAWIGASILASLGTFHQMWVSKAEYEEAGAERILNHRFR